MGTISSLGIASGIDSNSIVSQLVALEKMPLTALQAAATIDNAQITAFGKMQSEFSALATAANAMVPASAWDAMTARSSNSAAAAITVTPNGGAVPSSFTLNVDKLASTQQTVSSGITTGTAVGAGTLTIQLGTWTQGNSTATPPTNTTFASAGSAAVNITVSATDTVATIAAKINAAGAGVTATDFNDGTSDHLLLSSQNSGVSNGYKITAADSSGNPVTNGTGVSQLAFDPTNYVSTTSAGGGTTSTLDPNSGAYGMAASGNPVTYAQNAQARINGMVVTSASNTLSTNIPGVTITLAGVTTANLGTSSQTDNPVTLAITQDVTGVVANVSTFVSAYNTLITDMTTNTAYDAATNTPSLFQGDGSIVGLDNLLQTMVGATSTGSSVYQRLSDVGVQVQADGTLSINTTTLAAAANNGTEMQKAFSTKTGNAATDGFAVRFGDFCSGALVAGGLVSTKAAALQAVLTQNTTDQATINTKAAQVKTRLQAQYTALDTQMASLNALNSYVTQQVTTWNKATS